MSTTGHESEAINVQGLKASMQKFKTDHVDGKADQATTLAGYGITDAYTKSETYTKTEVNGLVDTPHQNYVTVATYASLPASGSADTIYRVSNYNGSTSQVDVTSYSEYAWNGSSYTFLCVKSQIGEVFDISVYNNNAKYADLAAALNGGANIPQSLQKGGMSIKYVQSSDNKYIQARCMAQNFTADVTKWQGVDDEPTTVSDNLVKSGGVLVNSINNISKNINGQSFLPIVYQKNVDDNGNYSDNPVWCSSEIAYLRKGTIIDVSNSNYRIYVRRWESLISSATCEKIGYIEDFPYSLPNDGYYAIAFNVFNNSGVNVAQVESNYTFELPNVKTSKNTLLYTGETSVINAAQQLLNYFWKRVADNRNYVIELPFKKGNKAELSVGTGIQVRYILYKGGTIVDTTSSWSSSFALYNYTKDCDRIDVYFRLYDGTTLHNFDLNSINTIVEGIQSVNIEFENYVNDGVFVTEQCAKNIESGVEKASQANILLGNNDVIAFSNLVGVTYDDIGALIANPQISGISPIYLCKGAQLFFESTISALYIRVYKDSISQANLITKGYVNSGYVCEFTGIYLITFRSSSGVSPTSEEITNHFHVVNKGIPSIYNYNKKKIEVLDKSIGKLISDNKVLEFTFPAKQFFGAKVLLNTGNNVQVYALYQNNGNVIAGYSNFGLGWSYDGYGFICEKECDSIVLRFRIYDGTSVSTLTDTEINTILSSILLLQVDTYEYSQTEGLDATSYQVSSKYKLCPSSIIKSICHQGLYHHSLAGGYKAAALVGFDYGETDVQMTSDNIPVCCHDDTFVDENTQNTITIAQHTLAELKTYNYHGGKIASLEEIIKECKMSGIGIVLDQINTSSNEFTESVKLLKKYNMINDTIWLVSGTLEGIESWCTQLYAALPNAFVEFALHNVDNDVISFANTLSSNGHKLILSYRADNVSVQDLISASETINAEIEKAVWTVDYVAAYENYFPYVNFITSNCISYRIYREIF